tara:strand:+ start:405 stop:518 length:114 start_codon:yes stop_codon:yes gene_type:complete
MDVFYLYSFHKPVDAPGIDDIEVRELLLGLNWLILVT